MPVTCLFICLCIYVYTWNKTCFIRRLYSYQWLWKHYMLLRQHNPNYQWDIRKTGGKLSGLCNSVSNHQPHSTVYSDADKKNIKATRHWPLYGEFTGYRWIPRTNGQYRGKCFHLMTSSCIFTNRIVDVLRLKENAWWPTWIVDSSNPIVNTQSGLTITILRDRRISI